MYIYIYTTYAMHVYMENELREKGERREREGREKGEKTEGFPNDSLRFAIRILQGFPDIFWGIL